MVLRLYVMESFVYRIVGLFEDNMSQFIVEDFKDGW